MTKIKDKIDAIKTGYKHKRWERINWDLVKQVYILREEEISLEALSKEFNIAAPHLVEQAGREKWKIQRRLWQNKTLLKTAEKLSEKQSEIRAKNIMVAEGALALLANMVQARTIKGSVSDIDKIIRLIEFLYGQPDSRSESNVNNNYPAILQELMRQRMAEHRQAKEMEDGAIKPRQLMPPKNAD